MKNYDNAKSFGSEVVTRKRTISKKRSGQILEDGKGPLSDPNPTFESSGRVDPKGNLDQIDNPPDEDDW